VVLHGCTQDAAGYDRGAGWSQLAEEQGFAVLLPEQCRSNNMNLCFNWYEPRHSRRGVGEPLSIVQMIDTMVERHGLDRQRVFVTGLSAGGAMTSVMLATYPEVFAGGAIIAGLPYGTARSVPEAFDRMRGHGGPDSAGLAALVRGASKHEGPWPSVAVWHGSADHTVDASNGEAIVAQWLPIHGVPAEPSEKDMVDGYPHRLWRDAAGRAVIEDYLITGMGHGTPLATAGEDGCGISGAYMLEVAISSTRHIAAGWGVLGKRRRPAKPAVERIDAGGSERVAIEPAATAKPAAAAGVGKVIEDALRAAGLMR
jgi:poly(hydroxyalkanoate) depolymerase family esterase